MTSHDASRRLMRRRPFGRRVIPEDLFDRLMYSVRLDE